MNESGIVKEYEIIVKPEIDEKGYLLDKVFKNCKEMFFHTFEFRCVYNIEITNLKINVKIILNITRQCMKFKSEFQGLNEKKQKCNIIVCYYLKFRIPIMHRQVFRMISQNPEFSNTHCTDLNNAFHFACRRWILYNQSL